MVLQITPAAVAQLGIWIAMAIAGRFLCAWISDAWGRRAAGVFSCLTAAISMCFPGISTTLRWRGVDVLRHAIAAKFLR
jgi:hypothetical protein